MTRPYAQAREMDLELIPPGTEEWIPQVPLEEGRPGAPPPGAIRRYVRQPFRTQALVFLAIVALGGIIGFATTSKDPVALASQAPSVGVPGGVPFTVAGIWMHNLLIVCLPIALFPLLFWGPAVSAFATGFVTGKIVAIWAAFHLPGSTLVAALAPHGLIEIPATLVGAVIAWRMGMATWDRRMGGSGPRRAVQAAGAAVPVVVMVILVLGVAAFVEVKVTPWVVLYSIH